jgi:hypothetical protein
MESPDTLSRVESMMSGATDVKTKQQTDSTSDQRRMYRALRDRTARQARRRQEMMERLAQQRLARSRRSFRHPSR